MLERIQYALFILLFVLAGSLDGAQVQSGRAVSQPDQIRQSSLRMPVPAHNCFTAAVFTCDASIENPVQPSAQKAIVRLLQDLRAAGKTCLVVHHDLQTVSEYFDHVLLMNMRVVAFGPTDAVFTKENLHKTYGGKLTLLDAAAEAMGRSKR